MSKLLNGTLAVVLMTGVLTSPAAGGAEAALEAGTIETGCHADNLNNPRVGNPARITFRVGTNGNGQTRGKVFIRYERVSDAHIERQYTFIYTSPAWEEHASPVPRGKYDVQVFFNAWPRDTAYKNCRTNFRQTIRPRR